MVKFDNVEILIPKTDEDERKIASKVSSGGVSIGLFIDTDEDIEKSRIYLKPGEKAPEGYFIEEGKRGGKYYEPHIVSRKVEGESDYKRFLKIEYNKLLKPSTSTQTLISRMAEKLHEERQNKMGKENSGRGFWLMSDWVEGVLPRLVGMRMIWGKMIGQEISKEDIHNFISSFTGKEQDEDFVDSVISFGQIMSTHLDMKTGKKVEGLNEKIMESEHEYSKFRTQQLFGSQKIPVWRTVYGGAAQEILDKINVGEEVEIDEFPLVSYSQDYIAAFAFSLGKLEPKILIKRDVDTDEVFSAWYSNPAMMTMMPEQKEIVITPKKKFVVTKDEVYQV